MDGHGHMQDGADPADDAPSQADEASLRAMLDQSRRDIAAGRTVALDDAVTRLRATASRLIAARGAPAAGPRQG